MELERHTLSPQQERIFLSHLESFCAGFRKCGDITVQKIVVHAAQKIDSSKTFYSENDAQYLCIIKQTRSQRTQCKKCLEERSKSKMIGEFLLHNSTDRASLHMYVLNTLEESETIINSCKSSLFCNGVTFLLSTAACDSFIQNLPLSNSSRVSRQSGSHRPGLSEMIFHLNIVKKLTL